MQDLIGYDEIIESSMRSVIFETLKKIEKTGLPGNHYFVITFMTSFPDVKISKELSSQYQDEMTIAIQYQYKSLKVYSDYFQISLSFKGKYENLTIPYKSITSFADPSMNFALKFSMNYDQFDHNIEKIENSKIKNINKATKTNKNKELDLSAKVVSLDDFRKNNRDD
ncbi:MAG: hypothetical protein CMP18_01190 [Rickettsiales bacterium]|jgi:uncharacterized protein|nr:hypothetical protein [Rickettsiales bacterium]|tara:strand:+ start:78 stop:581 length:504 start_codon:yes stop_codon:yes gene_type:complete